MARIILFVILYGIIPGVQAVLYIIDLPFVTPLSTVNYIFSIFTYYAVFNHLLISVKIPRLQHLFPYDKMVKFHALSGILLTIMIYYHGAFKLLSGKELEGSSDILFYLWTALLILAVLWIDTPYTRKIRKILFEKYGRLRNIPYDFLKIIHEYLFVVFGFISFIHVNESNLFYSSFAFITLYGTIFPPLVLAIVVYARIRRLFLPRMSVISVRNEAQTLVLTLQPLGKRRLRYHAGQFGYLKVLKKGIKREDHPFSFLSNPHEEQIMMGIKSLGDFTESIQSLEPGDIVRINGGFGNFIPKADETPKVFIGSGIGIVPLVSLIRQMRHTAPKAMVKAFLAVTVREELLFEKELRELEESIENLKIHIFVYQEDGILYTADIFSDFIEDLETSDYYLCSSPRVRTIVTSALNSLGVKEKQIHFEAFSY